MSNDIVQNKHYVSEPPTILLPEDVVTAYPIRKDRDMYCVITTCYGTTFMTSAQLTALGIKH